MPVGPNHFLNIKIKIQFKNNKNGKNIIKLEKKFKNEKKLKVYYLLFVISLNK